jgi:hypothetical protein
MTRSADRTASVILNTVVVPDSLSGFDSDDGIGVASIYISAKICINVLLIQVR